MKFKINKDKIYNILFIIATTVFFVVFIQAAGQFLKNYFYLKQTYFDQDVAYVILNALLYIVGLLIPFFIYKLVFKNKIDFYFKFENGKKLLFTRNILISILLGFLLQGVGMGISGLTSLLIQNNTASTFVNQFESISHPFLFSFCIAIFPAIIEELVFRGIIFTKASEKFSPAISALICGLCFGIYHLDLQQFLYAAILGYVFALIYNKTKNILDVMIIHFVIDFSQLYMASNMLSEFASEIESSNTDLFSNSFVIYSTLALCLTLLLICVPLSMKFYNKYKSVKD